MFKTILNFLFPQPVEVSTFVGDNRESLTRLKVKLDSVDGINDHIDYDDYSDVSGEELIGDEWMEYPPPK